MITTTCWILWIPDDVSTTGDDVELRAVLEEPFDVDGDNVDGDTVVDDADAVVDGVDADAVVDGADVDGADVDDVEHAANITATALADTISFVRVLIPTSPVRTHSQP